MRRFTSLIAALALATPAFAQGTTTINNLPAANAPLYCTEVVAAWQIYQTVKIPVALAGAVCQSATAPLSPFAGQQWWDTSPGAGVWSLRVYDGASWLPIGRLDTTAHVWTPATNKPVQTVTGTSKTFAATDFQYETRRSNSTSAMTDTFPAAAAGVNGALITVTNVDASASDTITAGSGTTVCGASSCGSTTVVPAGRSLAFVFDSANTAWRPSGNSATAVIGPTSVASGNLASFADSTGKTIVDTGFATSQVATLTGIQTLTNKTLTAPVMTAPSLGVASGTSLALGGAAIGSNRIAASTLAINESAPLGSELTSGTGWTSTNWTGSYAAGFTHTVGNTSNLSYAPSITIGNYYLVRFTVASMTAGSLNVSLGGLTSISAGGDLPTISNGSFSWAVKATSTAALNFIPTTDFDGKISAISVTQVTGTYSSTTQLFASDASSEFEVRAAPTLVPYAVSGIDLFIGVSAGSQNVTGGKNTAVGTRAMQNNISGAENVAIGYQSQQSMVAGWYNVAVGHRTMESLLNGYDNTAVGDTSLLAATSAHSNSCFGNASCLGVTTGIGNTALGDHALDSLLSGQDNIAIGHGAAQTGLGAGIGNIAIGANAMIARTGDNAVIIGTSAGTALTSGTHIVGIGYNALATETTATDNTAVGYQAMTNATGGSNTAVGSQALLAASGTDNTAIGQAAGGAISTGTNNTVLGSTTAASLTTGADNTALGWAAFHTSTAGKFATAIGDRALYNATSDYDTAVGYEAAFTATSGKHTTSVGALSLFNTAGGWENTALGYNAGATNTSGQNNTYLGSGADANAGTYSSSTALGYLAVVTASNQIMLGTSAQIVVMPGTSSPASGAACAAGSYTWDTGFIYICTASGAWKRAALTGGY